MNRSEFIRYTAKKYSCDQKTTRDWVFAIMDAMGEILASGEGLMITNLGSFQQQVVKPKVGRNRFTGERIDIPKHRKIRFDLCDRLDAALNGISEEHNSVKN